MNQKNTYAVFGLGRYGMAVARELIKNKKDVLAIDINEENVNDAIDFIPICKCADITDINVIKELGIKNVDTVIIAIASNLEASVMAVTLCKEVGVETVIVKCANEMHKKILYKVGADKVVFPEDESGTRLAKNLVSSGISDIFELSDDCSIMEINIPAKWVGKTLIDLALRKKYSINVIAIKNGDNTIIDINPEMPLTSTMSLIVVADEKKIKNLL